jgi:hypothetical protein
MKPAHRFNRGDSHWESLRNELSEFQKAKSKLISYNRFFLNEPTYRKVL